MKILLVIFTFVLNANLYSLDRQEVNKILSDFENNLKISDKIVIRDGGFICCDLDELKKPVLKTIIDKKEIDDFIGLFEFNKNAPDDDFSPCLCCGWPGIDIYVKDKRLSVNSNQHNKAIRIQINSGKTYVDYPLTKESADKLQKWIEIQKFKEK